MNYHDLLTELKNKRGDLVQLEANIAHTRKRVDELEKLLTTHEEVVVPQLLETFPTLNAYENIIRQKVRENQSNVKKLAKSLINFLHLECYPLDRLGTNSYATFSYNFSQHLTPEICEAFLNASKAPNGIISSIIRDENFGMKTLNYLLEKGWITYNDTTYLVALIIETGKFKLLPELVKLSITNVNIKH